MYAHPGLTKTYYEICGKVPACLAGSTQEKSFSAIEKAMQPDLCPRAGCCRFLYLLAFPVSLAVLPSFPFPLQHCPHKPLRVHEVLLVIQSSVPEMFLALPHLTSPLIYH